MPELIGSTTPRAKAAATAASTAFPPRRITAAPASAASGCEAATAPLGDAAGSPTSSKASAGSMARHYRACYLPVPYGRPRPIRALSHRLPAHRRRAHGPVQLAVGPPAEGRLRPTHRGHRPVAHPSRDPTDHHRQHEVAGPRLGRRAFEGRAPRALLPDAAARDGREARRGAPRQGQSVSLRLHPGGAGPGAPGRRETKTRRPGPPPRAPPRPPPKA